MQFAALCCCTSEQCSRLYTLLLSLCKSCHWARHLTWWRISGSVWTRQGKSSLLELSSCTTFLLYSIWIWFWDHLSTHTHTHKQGVHTSARKSYKLHLSAPFGISPSPPCLTSLFSSVTTTPSGAGLLPCFLVQRATEESERRSDWQR